MKFCLTVAACAAASLLSCAASAATVVVTTAAQLDAALKSAAGGDIIKVAPGNYGSVSIRNSNFASPVTIVAANSARQPVFSHLAVTDSSGLKISKLVIDSPAPAAGLVLNAADIWRSHDIRVSDMVFRGVTGGGVSNEARGLRLSHSTNITVATSSFTELTNGITTDGSSKLVITDNAFSGIRVNGIISDGATNSMILRNRFSQFRPEAWDHPDAIQIFATDNATDSLRITDNLIIGDAIGQLQGVFISNNVRDRAMLNRITVSGNLLWGTMWNGIAASGANRVAVTDNRVYSNAALAVPKAWVRLENVNAATVTNNYAGAYIYAGLDSLSSSLNVLNLSDRGALAETMAWDATHVASGNLIPYAGLSMARSNGMSEGLSFGRASAILGASGGAVPEPASWLSMIAGFMLIGAVSRRLQPIRARRIQPT